MRQIYSLIFRSTDLQIGQTERANLLNKSINGRRRPNWTVANLYQIYCQDQDFHIIKGAANELFLAGNQLNGLK